MERTGSDVQRFTSRAAFLVGSHMTTTSWRFLASQWEQHVCLGEKKTTTHSSRFDTEENSSSSLLLAQTRPTLLQLSNTFLTPLHALSMCLRCSSFCIRASSLLGWCWGGTGGRGGGVPWRCSGKVVEKPHGDMIHSFNTDSLSFFSLVDDEFDSTTCF